MVIFHSFLYVYQRVYGCKLIHLIQYLVGGIPTPLKNMKVSWDDEIPNIWKNKKFSKPPTSIHLIYYVSLMHKKKLKCVC